MCLKKRARRRVMMVETTLLPILLVMYPCPFSNASSSRSPGNSPFHVKRVPFLVTRLRGGAETAPSAAAAVTVTTANSALKLPAHESTQSYRVQQQLHLQSRSLQLRQELIARGLDPLRHGGGTSGSDAGTKSKAVDWDCAMSTSEHPKSCLYSFDAEEGAKVIAPLDTTEWITLSSLSRLRRSDPTKIEPLWHSQYAILSSWFSPSSKYSLYSHLDPVGAALSLMLDMPWLLATAIGVVLFISFLLTLPVWELLLTALITSKLVWLQWPNWGRFVHAALPLKLLMGQMAWKALTMSFHWIYSEIRTVLVDWECKIWENHIPVTILEGSQATKTENDFDVPVMNNEDEEDDDDDDDD